MQLRRIEVRNFRKIEHVVVEDLQDRLNVIVGDNEAGKSTLLAALRAALFERHRVTGSAADAMQPFGKIVRPEVAVDFDLGGRSWHLRKAFCQKPEARLAGPEGVIEGDEVEDRLAELFGFTPPGKGASNQEKNQGAYGLLWVDQGAAHRSLGMGAGRESIASALEAEVGQVMGGGRGRILLKRAEDRRDRFWSKAPSRDKAKARGDWKKNRDEVSQLQGDIADLEQQFAAYDGKVSELGHKQDRLARHLDEDRLNKAKLALDAARAAMQQTETLEQALREAEGGRKLAAAHRDGLQVKATNRLKLSQRAEAARKSLEDARHDLAQAQSVLEARTLEVKDATRQMENSRRAASETRDAVRALEEAIERQRSLAELAKLKTSLGTCEEADRKRREALAAAKAIVLTQEGLNDLEALQKGLDDARARLQAASVRIEFAPEDKRRILVGGEVLDDGGSVFLSSDAEVDLEGFGRLTVHPGGGVADLLGKVEAAAKILEDRLQATGVADLPRARSEWQRKLARQQEAENQKCIMTAVAPQGLEALKQSIDNLQVLVDRPVSGRVEALDGVSEATLQEARRKRDDAVAKAEAAGAEVRQAEAARALTDRELATRQERADGLERDCEGLVLELYEARAEVGDDALATGLAAAEQALAQQVGKETEARGDLDSADPELVRLELDRATEAEASIRKDKEALEREIRDLKVELLTLGRDGVGERLAELQGHLELKQKLLAAEEQEADASMLLFEVLSEAQRESKDRWLGPVRQRVEPYMRILHPKTDVVLNDESLELEGFIRNGREEPFASLSMGAREQVAVITRLALADILRSSNLPSAVILDDALVNTDEDRLNKMHLVLRKASANLQVLILTCRERDFHSLGGKFVRIGRAA